MEEMERPLAGLMTREDEEDDQHQQLLDHDALDGGAPSPRF
jgi:hypothetical protein